ncbi:MULTISPECIES: PP2C family protein-serine/threonine phosphatase [Streptacidiphilus]|uniref:PP2C family protein-serine/threonine phosphatase n=1 Tax=Streptacidiphilus cavernicola TaxID=3342716 RepID=A0ABV6UGR2_9ACTN|nr:PP2C family protein-serine/threonine phosphatase [Streptacidiphilus jeojiense]
MADSPSPRTGRTLDDCTLDGQAPAVPAPKTPVDTAPPAADPIDRGPAAGTEQSELTTLYELTERLTAASGLEETLRGALQAGAAILGAQRGMLLLADAPAHGADGVDAPEGLAAFGTIDSPGTTIGYGLDRPALGALETVPRDSGPYAGLLGGAAQAMTLGLLGPGPTAARGGTGVVGDRFQQVAGQLGIDASFALPLVAPGEGGDPFGAAIWFFSAAPGAPDTAASTAVSGTTATGTAVSGAVRTAPTESQQRLAALYCAAASRLIAKEIERDRLRRTTEALRRGLLPDRLPRVPGIQLAARCLPAGLDLSAGSDWYDALALPDGSLALSVGSVNGGGPDCAAAMGRIRAALRAYAVLEGEDPVSVLGDLELLLKTTEPARTATALYAYLDPRTRQLSIAGAGQCPPLLVTSFGASFVETSLSAPLGMLSCWEAPGVELRADRGDLLLLYTEGLARRCGNSLHAGQAKLRSAAAAAPREARHDPDRFCAHLLSTCLDGADGPAGADDIVLLAAGFE